MADTEVRADIPSTNYGSATAIGLDGSPIRVGYLRFNVSIPAGQVVSKATLRLFMTGSSSSNGVFVNKVSSTTWGETTTTYSNAPALGSQVAASGAFPANVYVSLDVTSAVSGNGPVSVAVRRSNAAAIAFNAREISNSNRRPQLVVESVPVIDTTAPTVSMSALAPGSTVSGTAVAVSANASDNVGVAAVQFKLDGANLGPEDTSAPYAINWNTTGVANGPHMLSAVARDANNNTATSSDVTVTVSNITISVSAPATGSTLSGSAVTVSANASSNVVGVQFKLDGADLGAEDTEAPYSISWDTTTATNGSHSLTAVGREAANNIATSSDVMVTVANLSVAMSAPAAGSTVSGTAVAVSADASQDIVGVQFKLDGANLGPEDTSAPYAINWDTTGAGNGSHTLTAVARDAADKTATSSAITVTVANLSVGMSAPAAGSTVSGTAVAVSADASQDIVGVQFKLDGVNLGPEDTSAPYAINWDTTGAANGPHTLNALARDAAANTIASSGVAVTISNGTVTLVSADSLPTWQINGVVWSQVVVNNVVFATGSFTKARPAGVAAGGTGEIAATNIFAYDITTGNRVSWFNHALNGQGLVIAASPDESMVYVGGDFTAVNGIARGHVASFSTRTGAMSSVAAPNVNGQVRALAVSDKTVYVGGSFSLVGGQARKNLAAFDSYSSSLLPWAPTADDGGVRTMVLTPDGSRVVVAGSFTTINGQSAYGMGSLDATTGANRPWAANKVIRDAGDDANITSLRADGTQIYGSAFVFLGNGGTGNFEGTFAADPTTGNITLVNNCHGDTYDVLPLGPVLYSVGHAHDCSWIRSFPDTNPRVRWQRALAQTIAPFTTNIGPDDRGWNYNGMPASKILHWFPQFSTGNYTGAFQGPWSLAGNDSYVAFGGEFLKVNGIAQQGLVRMAVRALAPNKVGPTYTTTPSRPVPPTTATSTSSGTANVSFGTAWDYDDETLKYELFRNGTGTPVYVTRINSNFWTLPTASFTDASLTPGSTLFYQVRITDPYGNVQWSLKSGVITVCCTAAAAENTSQQSVSGRPTTRASSAARPSRQGFRIYVDPAAPSKYQPVRRRGSVPKRVVPASDGRLVTSAAVRYSDRVLVSLAGITKRIEKGFGRGVFPERPNTAFTFKITNHSHRAIDLNQVVVTTQYGSPGKIASPVYDPSARDFSGILQPGKSATATYLFAIPKQNARSTVTIVDFDGEHAPARFGNASRKNQK